MCVHVDMEHDRRMDLYESKITPRRAATSPFTQVGPTPALAS